MRSSESTSATSSGLAQAGHRAEDGASNLQIVHDLFENASIERIPIERSVQYAMKAIAGMRHRGRARRRNHVKLIVWMRGTFTIVHKRLERGAPASSR